MLTCDKCNAAISLEDAIGIGRGSTIPTTAKEVVRIYCRACGQAAHRNAGKPGEDTLAQAHRAAVEHLAASGTAPPPTIPYPEQTPEQPRAVPPPARPTKAARAPKPAKPSDDGPRLRGLSRFGHFLATTSLRLLVVVLLGLLVLVCLDASKHPQGPFQGLHETYRPQVVKIDRELPAEPTSVYFAGLGASLVITTGLLLCFQGRSLARWFVLFVLLPGLTPMLAAVLPSPRPRPFFAVVGLFLTFLVRLSLLVVVAVLGYVVYDLVRAQADFRTALTEPLSKTLIPEGMWPFDWTLPVEPLWKYLAGWVGVVALLAVVLASALGRPPEAWFVQTLLVPPLAALCFPFASAEPSRGLGRFLRLLFRFASRLLILLALASIVFLIVDVLLHHNAPSEALREPLAVRSISLDWELPRQPLWQILALLDAVAVCASVPLALLLKRSALRWGLFGVFVPLVTPLLLLLTTEARPTRKREKPQPTRSSPPPPPAPPPPAPPLRSKPNVRASGNCRERLEKSFGLTDIGNDRAFNGLLNKDAAPSLSNASDCLALLESFRLKMGFDEVAVVVGSQGVLLACDTAPPLGWITSLDKNDAAQLILLIVGRGGKNLQHYEGAMILAWP